MDPLAAPREPMRWEARLDALEAKLAFIDDVVDTLNRTVFRQQQRIDQLALALSALRQHLPAGGSGSAGDARDDIPPHY